MTTLFDPALEQDAATLETFIRLHVGVVPDPRPGWAHIGQIITDAVLHCGASDDAGALMRVHAVRVLCPDATAKGFAAWLSANDVPTVLRYAPGETRLLERVTMCFIDHGIDTVEDLRAALADAAPAAILVAVEQVQGVGAQAVGCLSVLAGLEESATVAARVKRVLLRAGIALDIDEHERPLAIMEIAAKRLGWSLGSLDAAMWTLGVQDSHSAPGA